MRKLFWFGCAASVTAAAFVFVTARHAHKHPTSLTGHLVRGAYTAVGWSNPVLQGVRMLGAQVAFTVGRTLATEATPATPPEATPCCTSRAPRCEPATCEIPQVIDLARFEQAEAPNRCDRPHFVSPELDGELARELEWLEQQAVQTAPVTVVVTAGEGEENEPVPAMMPAAQDEDDQLQEVQDIEFWREFDDIPEPESVEVEQLPMPRELEEPPAATEGSTETDGVEPVEGTDGIEEGEAPDCQEIPEIDHHHSGCPSMGGCPYTGRCPPMPSYPTNKERE